MHQSPRGIQWRRWRQDIIVRKRLEKYAYEWKFGLIDANGTKIQNPLPMDFIGTDTHFKAKTLTTDKYDTRYKSKFSPNRTGYYRDGKKHQKREKLKQDLIKIKQQYGI